ncbi:hypothetical protein FRC06_006328, partial [Ceratobasidium sp. 370]
MAKKKTAAQKKAATARVGAVSPLPQQNGSGEAASPTEVSDDKVANKEQVAESETKNEDVKDATSPTVPATPTTEAPVATTPITTESPSAPPLSKSQKKRLARKASAGGAIVADAIPAQTIEKPSDNPESTAMTNGLGGVNAENEEPVTPAAEADDAWGFDKTEVKADEGSGERPVETETAGEPDSKDTDANAAALSEAGTVKASKTDVPDAAPSVAVLDGATPDDTRKTDGTPDETANPIPSSVATAHPDDATGSGDAPSKDPKQGTLPLPTVVDGDPPETTKPNGMPAPRLPNDDDAPLVPA